MAQFEQLQDLWQGQQGPAVSAEDTLRLTRSLRSYDRRQRWISAAKTLIVGAVLAGSMERSKGSAAALAGLALVGLAAGALIIREWRDQRAIARLDFGTPSVGFIRSAMGKLTAQRDPWRRYYWPFMGTLVIAMNLMLTGKHRVWTRVASSAVPFLAYEFGMWVRRKRFELECRPLLDQLSAMRSALEERGE